MRHPLKPPRYLVRNPSRDRVKNAELFDNDTLALVATGDRYLFDIFGYDRTKIGGEADRRQWMLDAMAHATRSSVR